VLPQQPLLWKKIDRSAEKDVRTTKVTDAGIQDLNKLLPGLEILH